MQVHKIVNVMCIYTYYMVPADVLQDQTHGKTGYQLKQTQAQQNCGHIGHTHRTHDVKL